MIFEHMLNKMAKANGEYWEFRKLCFHNKYEDEKNKLNIICNIPYMFYNILWLWKKVQIVRAWVSSLDICKSSKLSSFVWNFLSCNFIFFSLPFSPFFFLSISLTSHFLFYSFLYTHSVIYYTHYHIYSY